jgi:hypothetical protein
MICSESINVRPGAPTKMKHSRRSYIAAYASLRLYSEGLDPFEITARLELPPDHIHRNGNHRITRTKKGEVKIYAAFTAGMWSMSSKKWVKSHRLETHIRWILEQIQPKAEIVKEILASGVTGDVFCYSFGKTIIPPPVPRVLQEELERLGLKLDIDHYC